MPSGGTPQWQKSQHTRRYGTQKATTTTYKNLKMHINTEALNTIKASLVNLANSHIRYGIVDDVKYPMGDLSMRGGMYVAEIWKRLEYGYAYPSGNGGVTVIPPRPIFSVHLMTDAKADFKKFALETTKDIFNNRYQGENNWIKFGLAMQRSLVKTVKTYKAFKPLVIRGAERHVRSPLDFYNKTGFLISNISYRYMPTSLP